MRRWGHFYWGSSLGLLQEISDRLKSESGRTWDRFADLAYEATVGIAHQYRRKALELVKITAATYYVQGLNILRKHALLLFLLLFTVVLLAVTVVIVPVAMILATEWSSLAKVISLAVLGVAYAGTILVGLKILFSEERWMKATGFQELLDSIKTDL